MVKEESARDRLMDWAAALTLLTMTFSIPVIVTAAFVPAVPPATEIDRVSVPAPPLMMSPAWNVVPAVFAAAVLAMTPVIVSLLAEPAIASTPVVSHL